MVDKSPDKIVLLGANGQIATEVALYLRGLAQVQLHGMVRSRYGTVLLDMAGIPCSVLDYARITDENRVRLFDAQAIVDCTYPAGQSQNLTQLIQSNANAVMQCMSPGATYVHASSISAFGMPIDSTEIRDYRFARTHYARTKRNAENNLSRLASRRQIRVCHLRLGQVHGVLQSVTRQYCGLINGGVIHSTGTPTSMSTTVFCHSVAEAFLKAARGEFPDAGIITVVSQPQWTLTDLFDVYRKIGGAEFDVHYDGVTATNTGYGGLIARLIRMGTPFRTVIESQVLPYIPGLVPKLKGQYRMQSVRRDRKKLNGDSQQSPLFHLVGAVPGQIADKTRSSPSESVEIFLSQQTLLNEILHSAIN